jgi:hypothetical protein
MGWLVKEGLRTAEDDRDDEERPAEVTPECDEPVEEHLVP